MLALLFALAAAAVVAKDTRAIPDSDLARLELYARMQTINAEILGGTGATIALTNWCREHRLADPPVVVAVRVKTKRVAAPAQVIERLQVASGDELMYRRVELRCGSVVMSKAENWFVPARLTAMMNAQLDHTETPFGAVVAPLKPFRRTIASQLLWFPLARGEAAPEPGGALRVPKEIFRHRALVYTGEMKPIAEVSEVYQGALLKFPLQYVRAETLRITSD